MDVLLRRLLPEDWALLRDIRLHALQADPHVFGSSFAKENARSAAIWRGRLEDPDTAVFGVFDAGGAIAGMTAITAVTDAAGKTAAKMWGSWLRPDLRGRGLSAPMYRLRIDWARTHPAVGKIIVSHRVSNIVSHRVSNTASMRANAKHGFVRTHEENRLWPDGVAEAEVFYALHVREEGGGTAGGHCAS